MEAMSMNRAYRMHAEHLKTRKRESIKEPVTDEGIGLGAQDLSLADIFVNKREHDLFVNYFLPSLDEEQAREFVEASVDKKALTEEQEIFLENARADYNRLRTQAEHIKKHLTLDDVGEMAERNENIRIIAGKIGKEQAAKFLTDHMEELAVKDTQNFEQIAGFLKTVHTMRNSREADMLDKRIENTLKKYGVTDEEYNKAITAGAPKEIKRYLQNTVQEQLKGWRATLGFFVKRYRVGKLYASIEAQENYIEEINTHLVAVAQVLRDTLNPNTLLELQNAVLEGKKVVEKSETDAFTIEDFQSARAKMVPGEIKGRFLSALEQETVKKHGKDKKWNDLNPAEKKEINNSAFKANFLDKEILSVKNDSGKRFLRTLLKDKIQIIINSVV